MPALHAFRHLSLSPPDNEHDLSHIPPVSLSGNPDSDMTPTTGHYLTATSERTRYQPRRTSALSYQNSGARDPRDRSFARSPRNLVVVIPPPDFPFDQGQLGNILSMGPRYRLSQGILMPLFPSIFGQLNAIAREYNFPSTVGLCLYLHVNQSGGTMTPRISDDSWQYLFGHLFEGRPSSGQQLPIGESIEFDIDLNKARWFDAWVAGTLRDSDPTFLPVATSQAFGGHSPGESQTTNADEQAFEDRWDASGSHTLLTNSRPETLRHLPRKLSLVERLDSHGVHAPPKSQNHPDHLDSPAHTLSPIPQSAIPQATKNDLERRVNSWRATAELYPVSMTETYQPAPDVGVSVDVTIMDEYALEHKLRKAGNNDEYLSLLTSAGPRSSVMASPIASIHLDHHANGIVPLAPATVTSWGPTDDEWSSVVSDTSRLPSPDMGERMVEDIMTLRQCAVWGNSFGWRSAMTWKDVYPYSASQTKPTIQVLLQDSNGQVPQYPNLLIYPPAGSHPDTDSKLNIFKRLEPSPRSVWGSSFGWQTAVTWRKVYPCSIVTVQSVAAPIQLRGAGGLEPEYPKLCIYPAIYPSFEIYPACTIEENISRPVTVMLNRSSNFIASYPGLVIYPAVYPHLDIYPQVVDGVKMKGPNQVDINIYPLDCVLSSYPKLVIYPAVYPHFDLYPKALQITETLKQKEVDVRLVNVGCLIAEYPNMTVYPSAYPYLEIYPTLQTRPASSVVWGISFGWLTHKTWLEVYPLHTANSLTRPHADGQSRSISRPWGQSFAIADIVVRKQAVWGSSFGWEGAATWRTVWPTPYARIRSNASPISVHLGQQSDSSSNFPYFIIYPATYPYFDIYPARAAIIEVEECQTTKKNQYTVKLVPHYPNLAIYPVVYPHLDVYPAFARDSGTTERGKGQSNLRHHRIEMWRARTAAQVGLAELLANNHIWEVDEPLQLDLADYAWSRSSAGPPTPLLELPPMPSVPGSVHIARRIQGSVLLTPSTATTWGPQDDDWYSDILSIERLPSPDLGQRVLDDVENTECRHQPRHAVWPIFGSASQVKNLPSVFEKLVPEYPYLVIYPPAYPHFELYPTWANVSTLKHQATEMLAYSNMYPAFDIYPAIYPHLNVYPAVLRIESPSNLRVVSNVRSERAELPADHACYPCNLDHIYPFSNAIELTQIAIKASHGYPWLVVYPPVYPFKPEQSPSMFSSIEWKSVSVNLVAQYPTLEIYSAGYPWSLESIYPAVSVGDCSDVAKPQYPSIWIYPAVYPFVQPYHGVSGSIHIPGALDEGEYASAEVFLALSELKRIDPTHAVYPYFGPYATAVMPALQEGRVVQDVYVGNLATPTPRRPIQRNRKTHMELHASVFRSLGKRPARNSKTHAQLHTEVLQDGIIWTPSGYTQDISYLTRRKPEEIPVRELQHRPSQDNSTLSPPRPKPGTVTTQSPDKVSFPLGQPPALPPLSPLRVRTPVVSSPPSPAVSESPMPRVSLPSIPHTHKRTASSRLTQAVKSMLPGLQRRNSSMPFEYLPPEDNKERVKDHQSPARFLSLVERRSTAVPEFPHTTASEFLTRAPPSSQRKESLVLQRARAYEQATGAPLRER